MLRALPAVAFCAMLLAGCGTYRPLYGTAANGSSVATSLAQLMVQEQHTRAGQLVRNELLDGAGTGHQRYALNLTVTEAVVDVATLSSELGSRRRETLKAHFDLVDTTTSKTIDSGDSFSNVEFDTVNIPVADLQAADNARSRAATELGQDIRLRLAAFLSQHQG